MPSERPKKMETHSSGLPTRQLSPMVFTAMAGSPAAAWKNSLNIFGAAAPGWFMKTEYRVAEYQRRDVRIFGPAACRSAPQFPLSRSSIVQTVSTSLVYRFNWGGAPVVAKMSRSASSAC
jgi:hypothetical protein